MADLNVFIDVAGVAESAIARVWPDVQTQSAVAKQGAQNRIGIGRIALAAVAEVLEGRLGDGVGVFPADKADEGDIDADFDVSIEAGGEFSIDVKSAERAKLEILAELADSNLS